jgi:alanine dehydrogenase
MTAVLGAIMIFGIINDPNTLEHRVILAPYGVEELVAFGHEVIVESGAGTRAHFSDEDYRAGGARIVTDRKVAWQEPDVLLRFQQPSVAEFSQLRRGQLVCCYPEAQFLDEQHRNLYREYEISLLALEEMIDQYGGWPMLSPLSLICGRMLPQTAARFLESFEGGRGKLIMGVPGVAPCNVAIIGAGTLGATASHMFQLLGARVTVLDKDHRVLERLASETNCHIATLSASPGNISRVVRGTDVLILAIHSQSGKCPKIITREHLKDMDPRALIIDSSITQGGAAETSRPTTVDEPVYIEENVIHHCLPNITNTVARTTSRAVSSALVPFLETIGQIPLEEAMINYREFDTGLICIKGNFRRRFAYSGFDPDAGGR